VRPFDLNEFANETDRLREIYCGAWEHNWGFVAPTDAEFKRIATEMKQIFDTRSAILAEAKGKPIACAVAIPDVNQALRGTDGRLFPLGLVRLLARKWIIDQIRLLLLGILPEYRTVGIFPLLREMFPAARSDAGPVSAGNPCAVQAGQPPSRIRTFSTPAHLSNHHARAADVPPTAS